MVDKDSPVLPRTGPGRFRVDASGTVELPEAPLQPVVWTVPAQRTPRRAAPLALPAGASPPRRGRPAPPARNRGRAAPAPTRAPAGPPTRGSRRHALPPGSRAQAWRRVGDAALLLLAVCVAVLTAVVLGAR